MEFPYSKIVVTKEETTELAVKFSHIVKTGDVIVLTGQLGAGKTFFIKQALKQLGADNVNSPSFPIINEYDGKIKYYHADFFRLKNIEELFDIGWQDYLNDENAATFIEWGNLIPLALPDERIEINISVNDDSSREFNFNYCKK